LYGFILSSIFHISSTRRRPKAFSTCWIFQLMNE
jgi:hypothetical protein